MKSRPLFSLLVTGPLAAVAMPLALFATILAKGTSKKRKLSVLLVGGVIFAISAAAPRLRISAQDSRAAFSPTIPKTWDDQAMATIEVPLANPAGSPKHVSAAYYYRIPVRPIYKHYPVYAPGHEPPGYMGWLKRQEPVIVWDDDGHRPPLNTQEDWVKAGEVVFNASPTTDTVLRVAQARSPDWWAKVGTKAAKDGTLPGYGYVISKKAKIEVGDLSCAACHTRVTPDGTVLIGAQGNFPFDHNAAVALLSGDPGEAAKFAGLVEMDLFGAPWLKPDPQARLLHMSINEIAATHVVIPPVCSLVTAQARSTRSRYRI
jgi:hypothetical protein